MSILNRVRESKGFIKRLFSSDLTIRVGTILSIANIEGLENSKFIRLWISRYLRRCFGVYFSPQCVYGKGLRLKHPVGIVIGSGVKIGDNVTIFQNVTLGGRRMGDGGGDKYPVIGNDTVIFAGAVITGNVRIGNNCVVGANAVVLSDVPQGATAVGVPAKVINKR